MTTGRINQVTIICLVDGSIARAPLAHNQAVLCERSLDVRQAGLTTAPPQRRELVFAKCSMLSACAPRRSRDRAAKPLRFPFAYLGSPSARHREASVRLLSTNSGGASPRRADGARSIESNASERFDP